MIKKTVTPQQQDKYQLYEQILKMIWKQIHPRACKNVMQRLY